MVGPGIWQVFAETFRGLYTEYWATEQSIWAQTGLENAFTIPRFDMSKADTGAFGQIKLLGEDVSLSFPWRIPFLCTQVGGRVTHEVWQEFRWESISAGVQLRFADGPRRNMRR